MLLETEDSALQTSLAVRAVDSFSNEQTRAEMRESLLKYLDTDTIWQVEHPTTTNLQLTPLSFFEDYPPALVDLQNLHWSPLLDWAREEFKADIRISRSLMLSSQSSETKEIFRKVLNDLDAWQLACTLKGDC